MVETVVFSRRLCEVSPPSKGRELPFMAHFLQRLQNTSVFEPVPDDLVARITGRNSSLFAQDLQDHKDQITKIIETARILIIGAAGSIGSATVKYVANLKPSALVLVDINENELANLVRLLRSGDFPLPRDFATSVAAMGSPGFERLFEAFGPFDLAMNFAALKHVRSERDPFSVMRILETNVLATDQLISLARNKGTRVFSVSSDKAVYPGNLMGASKRWMERLLRTPGVNATSARFANVAFSRGSLLSAFCDRLAMRQPMAAPNDVERYFISHREAAELCLLGAVCCQAGEVIMPKLDPSSDRIRLDDAAARFLGFCGLRPEYCASAEEAKQSPYLLQDEPSAWPCFFSASNTAGEKPAEEFRYPFEQHDDKRFRRATAAVIEEPDWSNLAEARERVKAVAASRAWMKNELEKAIKCAVPELQHVENALSLDAKL